MSTISLSAGIRQTAFRRLKQDLWQRVLKVFFNSPSVLSAIQIKKKGLENFLYLEPTEKVFSAVESSEKGLTSTEAEQRLTSFKEAEKDSLFKKFINSLADDPMIIMLLVAAVIQAVVTAVSMDTEMGKIADALSDAEQEQTPLQKKMAELSKFLTKLVIVICVVVFAVGLIESLVLSDQPFSWDLLGNTALDTFISAIALAVAAIPEGLPAVVTIILSIGVTAMSKRQALIRKLTAVETLVICSDKTGTLTQNKMTVVDHFGDNEKLIAEAMALCSDAQIDGAGKVTGEPTEAALVGYAYALGMSKNDLVKANPRVGEAPFDSGRKMMSTVHQTQSGIVQYTKGAPDVVINLCKNVLVDGRIVPMDDKFRAKIAADNKRMADRALRVLAVALKNYDSVPASFEPEAHENDLVFVGLTGMIDPVRPEIKAAIKECRGAGITPIMKPATTRTPQSPSDASSA